MPTMHLSDFGQTFELPATQLGLIADRVPDQSVLARMAPERPTLFGNVQAVRMTQKPRAQVVGESEPKDSTTAAWETVMAQPVKFQTTVRVSDEVRWADEDHQLQAISQLTDGITESIARAVDLIGLHGINPLTGLRATQVTSYLNQTSNRVVVGSDPNGELEAAVGLVAGDGKYMPTGLSIDAGYAFQVATQRDATTGLKINPDMGYGFNASSWNGLTMATSSAVSGRPEAADTGLRAFLGDFTQLRWGFQRRIPIEVIPYGDPDGGGDLQRNNEIAWRAEGVIYVGIFDLDAFAAVGGTTPADAPAA